MILVDVTECRERVAEAERLLDRDSDDASRIATEILAQHPAIGDEVSSIAHRVLAVTALRRGNTDEASRSIDEAVAAGERSHVDVVLGKALMTAMAVAIRRIRSL